MRFWILALALLACLPASAANRWNFTTCTYNQPCILTFDTVGQAPRIQMNCSGARSFYMEGSGVVHPYRCNSYTFADCTRQRYVFEDSGVHTDAVLSTSSREVTGASHAYWILDIISGSGTVVASCGGG